MTRLIATALLLASASTAAAAPLPPELSARIDASMQAWATANHVPGLTWGIVHRGEGLVHQGQAGIADVASGRPVAADTRFRIASMTKAFTALTLLDLAAEGKLRLDDPVAQHLPETASWIGGVKVADLVHHMAGFVTDDPWGDRQTPLPEAQFTALLAIGVPSTRTPGLVHEYSNLGYAMLGRIIHNTSGQPFEAEIAQRRFAPLGMTSTSFDLATVPAVKMASGWRWEDGIWKREPDMAPGAFGAMGGVITTAGDYARWVDHLLSAWPAAAPGTAEPLARATVRRLIDGGGSPRRMARPTLAATSPCTVAVVYGAGFRVGDDCTLGRVAFHSGGYPGYGSHLVMAPDRGWGVFVFTNRTYAGPTPAAWDALIAIADAGLAPVDVIPLSPQLAQLVAPLHHYWTSGDAGSLRANLAVNVLMDRDAAHRAADIAAVKAKAGACPSPPGVKADGALEGDYLWKCASGMVIAHVLLAPTPTPQIQAIEWSFRAAPAARQ
ncbi:MAG: serine hydrolase domain-containing protein [Sphingomonadales bacterium]|jgi:CubicO group peptidase (beta-lactamase class C family)